MRHNCRTRASGLHHWKRKRSRFLKGWWRIAMVLHLCDRKKEDVSCFCMTLSAGYVSMHMCHLLSARKGIKWKDLVHEMKSMCKRKQRAPLHVEERKGVVDIGGCALSHLAVFHNTIFLTAFSWYLQPKGVRAFEKMWCCPAAQLHKAGSSFHALQSPAARTL